MNRACTLGLLIAALIVHGAAAAKNAPALPAPVSPQDSSPTPAQAAAAVPPQEDPIIVNGVRSNEKEIDKTIAEFVGAFTNAPGGVDGQLSRFEFVVCPIVIGVSPTQKAQVIARFRKVSEAAGIHLAGQKCRGNVLIAVTNDKKMLLTALYKQNPEFFDDFTTKERLALADLPLPAIAWHLKGRKIDADGQELPSDFASGAGVNETFRSPSRIRSPVRLQFAAAFVVVESRALEGLTTTQLADYAVMRTLIRTDPEQLEKSTAPTILKILETPFGSPVPVTLTDWDFGVLRALYDSDPSVRAISQRSEIRRRLKKSLTAADAAAKVDE